MTEHIITYPQPNGTVWFQGPRGIVRDRSQARRFPSREAAEAKLAEWKSLRGADLWLLGRAVVEPAG